MPAPQIKINKQTQTIFLGFEYLDQPLFMQVEVMTLLQNEKSSQKMTLEKQIEDGQKALEKKERELLLLQEEMQKVN